MTAIRRVLPFLLLTAFACAPPAGAPTATGPASAGTVFPFDWRYRGLDPTATGRQGMVSAADARATQVGLDILQSGGNAVDAAVAVGFALAVVLPEAGNIGGGGFMVVRTAGGEAAALDFREMAPRALTPDHYLDREGKPTDASRIGHLAVGVPGTVAGLAEAHRRFGSLPWPDLVAPAIDLARNGFTVPERLTERLAAKAGILTQFEAARQTFYPGGEPPRPGSTFRQPALAQTLRLLAEGGSEAFYEGEIAESIVREMQENSGLITHDDLRSYTAKWRDPIVFEYRDQTIISMPPPSSGGVTLAQILNIVEGYDLRGLGWHAPEAIHLNVEAFRRAFADRNYYLGDPDFVEMPIERLTSDAYAAELRAGISRNRASSSEAFNRVPVLDESQNTTHYSIVDDAGNAVAFTTTLNSWFGSGVLVEGAGFFLNNELDDFTVRAGYPNQYGLIQGNANLVGPRRRPLSAMAPTIVLDSLDAVRLVLGSPGGPKIITSVAQVIQNVVDYGMDVRTAVDAPRFHHQLLPDEIQFETDGIEQAVISALSSMGHRVSTGRGYFGSVHTIVVAPDGSFRGAADPRRDTGRALGY